MKRLIILGAGESGVGAAVLGKKKGFDVFVSDYSLIAEKYKCLLNEYAIPWEEKQHTLSLILNADEVIKSPGISDSVTVIQEIIKKEIPIISEIEFAGRYTDAKMICITGSNGKTTTTMLTYHILKSAGLNVGVAGNIGKSLAMQIALNDFDYYIIELSSFQLDNMYDFKADIAVLLNITPDHLDRYNFEMQNYIDAKFRIVQNQTEEDAFVFWNDDPIITRELEKHSLHAKLFPFSSEISEEMAGYIDDDQFVIDISEDKLKMEKDEIALSGIHNMCNSLAAGISANIMNVKKEEIRTSLMDFEAVEHRLKYVATVRGVKYINDSKATNVNSCWYALSSMNSPVVLILGGKDKGNDYTEIETLVKEKVHSIIYLGVDNSKLHAFFDTLVPNVIDTSSMAEAVKAAYQVARPGDTVLLSPCCASFDLFKSYEDRGEQFINQVVML